jgi:hypothetical protein
MKECLIHGKVPFPAHHETAEIPQPSEGALDLPPALVTPQLATVLQRGCHPIAAMGTTQLKAPLRQPLPQGVRITGFVVDHTLRLLARSPGAVARDGNRGQGRFQQGHFRRGRRVQEVSQRKTLAGDHHHPLRTLATCGLPNAGPPVFAGAKLPSAKVSAQSRWPWASSWARNTRHAVSHTPWASQSRRRRQQVLGDGTRAGKSGQRAPLRRPQRMPSTTGRFGIGFGPPPGEALRSGNNGAIVSHGASVSSEWSRAIGKTPFAVYSSGRVPPRQPPAARSYETASNHPVERTAHSAGSVLMRGSVPVGRRSPGALGSCTT